ncbi:MAG: metallopeptidase TldD-related protein, partial [Thermoplasmata archaeon]|nr:metallopeptidase TldD-related protein [Thermoplasmata archaeon]
GAPVTDLRSAARAGTKPTGHGTPPESPYGDWGPTPTQQLLAPGSASFDDLVREVGDGLLVTRFHYVRVVHTGKSMLTGMTRDGTYRIEKGEVTTPVRNLRFTESVLGALASVEALGKERHCFGDEGGYASCTVPAAVVGRFRFTSTTAF